MNELVVYWCQDRCYGHIDPSKPSGVDLDLLALEPELLLRYIYNNRKEQNNNFLKCPAVTEELKNTFVIPSSVDFDLKRTSVDSSGKNFYATNYYDQTFYDSFVFTGRDVVQFSDNKVLFCEENLDVSQIPFTFDFNNEQDGIKIIPGSFNINKWFRPIHPSFIMSRDYISVSRGQPMYCLKFHTDRKIKFKRFDPSATEIQKIITECVQLKYILKNLSLQSMYNIFTKAKKQKLLFKHIKANLID